MVLRSVAACMDSGDWLQGGGMQHSGFETPVEDMLSCPRPLMDRRLKPSTELALKCPRCDSSNTKFCYYNNYSLSQPRYFCKACRRYWTKGGSLRNVPVGGGCRKNKRFKRTTDPPVQTEQSAASAPAINNNNNNNEMNSCSPSGLDHTNLNLPAVPSVYFTLLNGGADGLGVAYANRSVPQKNHQALKVAAPSAGAADRPLMVGSCNSSSGIMEIQATATATATHQPLANLSNLNTFQSLKAAANLITSGGPEQSALLHVSGDLTSIFEAHHHQQVPTSSTPAISHVSDNRFHDVTLHNNRLNSGLINDQDVQWQHLQQNIVMPVEDHESGHVPLPFDHDDANAVEELRPHNDVKLRQLIINGVQDVQSPLRGEENRLSFNWQLPSAESEGLLDTSANNMSYWNGGAWPDLSCYAPYTNSLI